MGNPCSSPRRREAAWILLVRRSQHSILALVFASHFLKLENMKRTKHVGTTRFRSTTRFIIALVLICIVASTGCGGCGRYDGPSENDLRLQGMADSAEALKGYGAKLKEVQYIQGKAYVVNLS